jgi:hypothetical protein
MTSAAADRLHDELDSLRMLDRPDTADALRAVLPFAAAVAVAFLLDRLGGEVARSPGDRARAVVARLGEEVAERSWTVGRDARAEARKRRAWKLLQAGTGALFAVLARRAAGDLYERAAG